MWANNGKEELEKEGNRQADNSGESDKKRPMTQDEVQTDDNSKINKQGAHILLSEKQKSECQIIITCLIHIVILHAQAVDKLSSASRLTSHKSVNSHYIETLSPIYHTIETVSVIRTIKYKKRPKQFMSNNLIDVQQRKNVYNTEKQMIKLDLLNIRSLSMKALFVNAMITDHKLDVLSLTETWLKPDEYIILNKSTPQEYCYKNETCPKGKGGVVATIYSNILSISQKTSFKYNSFEVMVKKILMINPQ